MFVLVPEEESLWWQAAGSQIKKLRDHVSPVHRKQEAGSELEMG